MRLNRPALIFILGLTIILATVVRVTSAYLIDTESSVNNSLTAWVDQNTIKFFMADDDDDRVYRYNSSGNYVDYFALYNSNRKPSGSAKIGSDLYILDYSDYQVYKYTTSGQYLGVSRVLKNTTGGDMYRPNGLAIYGDEIWVTEETGAVYRYSLSAAFPYTSTSLYASSSITLDYWTGNRRARGLAIDEYYLYVLDRDTYRIFRYLRSSGSSTYSKTLRQTDGSSLYYPSGAMYDGTSIWIVDYGRDEAYQYNLADLFTSGTTINAISEFSCTSDNGRSESI